MEMGHGVQIRPKKLIGLILSFFFYFYFPVHVFLISIFLNSIPTQV
jgi:hypothetical protein